MAQKLTEVTPFHSCRLVEKHTPRGWTAIESRKRLWMAGGREADGCVLWDEREIHFRPIYTVYQMGVFFHEVSHVHTRRLLGELPSYKDEYYAEKGAMDLLRAEGFAVPRIFLLAAKENVRNHIYRNEIMGEKISPRIRKWSNA
jgi:hypothetical protein